MTYTCNTGFVFNEFSLSYTSQCDISGNWNVTEEQCSMYTVNLLVKFSVPQSCFYVRVHVAARDCGSPPEVYFDFTGDSWGRLIASNATSTVVNARRSYACVEGSAYWTSESWSRTVDVTCRSSGQWLPDNDARCIDVYCSEPPSLAYSDVLEGTDSSFDSRDFMLDDVVQYRCHDGYLACGNSSTFSSKCIEFAMWTVTSTLCNRKHVWL